MRDRGRGIGILLLAAVAVAAPAVGDASAQATAAPPSDAAAEPEVAPELQEWIELCVQRLGSTDETVRRGAGLALGAAGAAARAALTRAAEGENEVARAAAARLLATLDRRSRAPSLAERPSASERRLASAGRRLALQLGLADEQAATVDELLQNYERERRELFERSRGRTGARDDVAGELDALRAGLESKLAEVLTAEQLERYVELYGRGGSEP